MCAVSEYDDRPSPDETPTGPVPGVGPGPEDTRPLGDLPPYPPAPQPQPQPGYGAPYPPPPGYTIAPHGPVMPAQPVGRMPGWAWPVIAATALVLGLLGGILGGVAVSSSMDGTVPLISTDNGAATPLRADNGSVAAVAVDDRR